MSDLIPIHGHAPELLHAQSIPQHWPLVFQCAKNLGARNFIGSAHSEVADGWLQSIDKVFTVMQLTDTERVHHVPSFLFGTARIWWHAKCAAQQTMTWADFCLAFGKEFCSGGACSKRKELPFQALSQGSFSVAEYTHHFNGSYPLEVNAVAGEQARCARYRHGLRPEIKARIAGFQTIHFGSLVEAALRAEKAELDLANFGGSITKPRSYYQGGGKRAEAGCYPMRGVSDRGHRGVNVEGCYECGEARHFRKGCPRPGHASRAEAHPRVSQSQSSTHEQILDGAFVDGRNGSFPRGGASSVAPRQHDVRPDGSRVQAEECAMPGMLQEVLVLLDARTDSIDKGRRSPPTSSYHRRKGRNAEAGFSSGNRFQKRLHAAGAEASCYECGETGHVRRGCPRLGLARSSVQLPKGSRSQSQSSAHKLASCATGASTVETQSWQAEAKKDAASVTHSKDPTAPGVEENASSEAFLCSLLNPACRLKKKLLILDLNGLLLDVVSSIPGGCNPDIKLGRRGVFCRPFYRDFLMFCFERFDVAVWSSKMKSNVAKLVDYLFGGLKDKLLFCWDLSKCTETRFKTIENKEKGLVFKELSRIWENDDPNLEWGKRDYDETNTLLVDDSPYKALLNPVYTAIFPHTFHFQDVNDNSLGEGGDLKTYLGRLVAVDNVETFVEQHRIGQEPITESNPHWPFYSNVIKSVNRSRLNLNVISQ